MNTNYAQHLPQEWQMVTSVFAALGDPTRQKIIMLFGPSEELAIRDIAAQFDLARTTIVHHLNVLHSNGILSMRKKGRETLFTVDYGAVLEAVQKMQTLMEGSIWASVGAKAPSDSKLDTAGLLFSTNTDTYYEDLGFTDEDLDISETTLLFVSEDSEDNDDDPS